MRYLISGKGVVSRAQQQATRLYVTLMLEVVGRGLVAASQSDSVMQDELADFAPGTVIQMRVLPQGPQFSVEVLDAGRLRLLKELPAKVDVGVCFKHMAHAFLVLSFQESTATAFAHDRMYVDGDISRALRLVRCLNRMEALILPKLIAKRAVKRYPVISLTQKLDLGRKIYSNLLVDFLRGE